MKIIPDSKPHITKEEAEKVAKSFLGISLPPLLLIGIRGYFTKTLGDPTKNDINMYDDAMIVYGLDTFATFNSNTDPSFLGRGLASLNEGIYKFYKGKHHGRYNALRSYPEGIQLQCTRDGKASMCSEINIHYGGMNPANRKDGVTYSHGCQTLPPTQWGDFIELVYEKMTKNGLKTITYILTSQEHVNEILK